MLTRATWAALCVAAAVAKFVPLGRQRPTAAIPGQEDEELPQTFIDTSQLHIGLLFATLNSGHQSMRPVQFEYFNLLVNDIQTQTTADMVHYHVVVRESHIPGIRANATYLPACTKCTYHLIALEAVLRSSTALQHLCRSVSEVSVDFADEVPLVSFTCLMFLRAVMYEAMPLDVEYAIVLDNDLRVAGDIRDLVTEHLPTMRRQGKLLALGRELSALHLFVGMPQRGFNGGVQLHDLRAMRRSRSYQSFLSTLMWWPYKESIQSVKGIGDQTLFAVMNYTHSHLIHELPCGWNRQLFCGWVHRDDLELTYRAMGERGAREWPDTPCHWTRTWRVDMELLGDERALYHCDPRTVRIVHYNGGGWRPKSFPVNGSIHAWRAALPGWRLDKPLCEPAYSAPAPAQS